MSPRETDATRLVSTIQTKMKILSSADKIPTDPAQGDLSSADKTLPQSSADNNFLQSSADNNFLQSSADNNFPQSPADQIGPHDTVPLEGAESSQMSGSHNIRNIHRETQRQTKGKDKELSEDEELAEIALKLKAKTYKTILILTPSATLCVWDRKMAKFFPFFTMRNFSGSPRSGTLAKKKATLDTSARALLEYIQIISDTSSAMLHVILSSFNTIVVRIKYLNTQIQDVNLRDALNSAVQSGFEDDDDIITDSHAVNPLNKDELTKYSFHEVGVFHRIVIDEAQKVKNVSTHINRLIQQYAPARRTLLTATPMINRADDMLSILAVMWILSWSIAKPAKPFDEKKPALFGALFDKSKYARPTLLDTAVSDTEIKRTPTYSPWMNTEVELKRPSVSHLKRKPASSLSSIASSRRSKLARRTPDAKKPIRQISRSKLRNVTPPTNDVDKLKQALEAEQQANAELRDERNKATARLERAEELTLHLAQLLKNATRNIGSLSEILSYYASDTYQSVRAMIIYKLLTTEHESRSRRGVSRFTK